MRQVIVEGADFSNADFRDAMFTGVDMQEAAFRECGTGSAAANMLTCQGFACRARILRVPDLSRVVSDRFGDAESQFSGQLCGARSWRKWIGRERTCAMPIFRGRRFTWKPSAKWAGEKRHRLGRDADGVYTDDYNDQDFKAPEEIRKANLCECDLPGRMWN